MLGSKIYKVSDTFETELKIKRYQPGQFFQDATVHHYGNAARLRQLRRFFIRNAFLHENQPRTLCDSLLHNGHDLVGAPEDIDDVDGV